MESVGGEGKPSAFMVHMMTRLRVVSRSLMRRLPTASAAANKPEDGRNTGNGNERGHPKHVNAEERGKAQGVVEELGEGVRHGAGFRGLVMTHLRRVSAGW